ncbi:hypothetical protein BST61_g10062 [Cercospora zeina]
MACLQQTTDQLQKDMEDLTQIVTWQQETITKIQDSVEEVRGNHDFLTEAVMALEGKTSNRWSSRPPLHVRAPHLSRLAQMIKATIGLRTRLPWSARLTEGVLGMSTSIDTTDTCSMDGLVGRLNAEMVSASKPARPALDELFDNAFPTEMEARKLKESQRNNLRKGGYPWPWKKLAKGTSGCARQHLRQVKTVYALENKDHNWHERVAFPEWLKFSMLRLDEMENAPNISKNISKNTSKNISKNISKIVIRPARFSPEG